MSTDLMSRPTRSELQLGDLAAGGPAHLSFLRQGRGRPVLLLHGFASDADADWSATGWIDALAKPACRVGNLILGGMGDRIAATVGLAPEFADALDAPDDERLEAVPSYALRFRRHAASRPTNDLGVLAACLRGQSGQFDLRRLSTVTVPTLVVAGAQDKLAGDPHPVAAWFAAGAAAIVPDVDHASALADPSFRGRALAPLNRDFATTAATRKST